MSGPEILRQIKRIDSAIPVIIITEHSNTQDAIDSMREGAYDYFAKPLDTEKTLAAIEKALHVSLPDENWEEEEKGTEIRAGEGNPLIGRSAEMVEIYKRIGQVASSDAAVLIQGESGTGKELVARAIHENSRRRNGPFLAVNCAAIPETLLESELFGYERGAFTGALGRKTGKFEQASGGTIFLDEIGDMSMPIQSKALRVLQEQAFTRVGGRETVRTDTRVVAATNKSLVSCMKEGTFRVDLFYRLKVVSIFLPPLRERGDDVLLLAEHFLRKYALRSKRRIRGFSPSALELLREHDWPGNVRELENGIQTAVLLSKTGMIAPEDLPVGSDRRGGSHQAAGSEGEDLADSFRHVLEPVFGSLTAENRGALYDRTVGEFEKALIGLALERVGGNQVKASQLLGISRNTLRNRIDRFRVRQSGKTPPVF
ncbi:MAG: sigma-54-dependent Fis family transcriptional regulator [Candidatus Eisenbacteria bacterium]|nr:sigma-54-dependent Fis family transcriptional regulator [Candidatus Eisenbacteria bacterium]